MGIAHTQEKEKYIRGTVVVTSRLPYMDYFQFIYISGLFLQKIYN